MLATAWKYVDDSNVVLQITIRDDVQFSDGTPLTVDAVIESLKRFKASNGPRASALASVESFEAVDDSTLTLHLSEPDPALAHNLALVAGMITNPDVEAGELTSIPAGTGPYILDLDATRRGDVYVFTRNPGYYDSESFPFDEVNLRVLTDPTARMNAIKTGQVDAIYGAPSQLGEAQASGLTVVSSPGDWQGLFLIDRDGVLTPALADERVRQAINYAIDGDAILDTVAFAQGTPTTQMFYPGTGAYDEALDDAYPHDPEKARELLAEAGYADGFALVMPSFDTFLPEVYPIITQQLAEVGIDAQFQPILGSAGFGPILGGDYSAFFMSWGASQNWLDATLLLSGSGGWNPFHVADPQIADLLSRIAASSGSEQDDLYAQLSAYVVEQAWFAPFYVINNLAFVGPDVTVTAQPQQSNPALYNYKPAK
ncbi:ABC transporter substrate-binding protein [Microbacterium phyllosphaerae]|uniref:ABC transporter substrate-binding protein n=1 Tax=Microbacterium phyllosphaerae TaxID=124798 RepID=UPI003D65380E